MNEVSGTSRLHLAPGRTPLCLGALSPGGGTHPQALKYFDHTVYVYRTVEIFLTHALAWFAALYLVAGITMTLQALHERAASPGPT